MMKRLCIVILAICLHSGPAQAATNVASQNAVGYVKVSIPPAGGANLVALNFRSIGGGGISCSELFGTNQLTQHPFAPSFADRIFLWDAAEQAYIEIFQRPDGNFYDPLGAQTDPVLEPGQSFWLVSGSGTTTTNEIFLMGEVVGSLNEEQYFEEGLNLFNSPYATTMVLTNDFLAQGATGHPFSPTAADNIFVWNAAISSYDQFFLRNDGKWYTPGGVQSNVAIPVGIGAWYDAKNNFTLTVTRAYNYPAD